MRVKKLIEKLEDREKLLQEMTVVAMEMGAKMDAERQPWSPSDHSRYNWASEYHHPCKKYLVHSRVDWQQRQQIDVRGRWRTDEGISKEWEVKKWLGSVGYEVTRSQEKFNTDMKGLEQFKSLRISGKIDGASPLNKNFPPPFERLREVPAEVKTVSPHYWNSTATIEDLKRHPKFWIQKIPSQLNTYMVFMRKPVGLLIIATFGMKPRILPMLFDPELWEADSIMAKSVNYYVRMKKYPEPMPFDPTTCGLCSFNHICKPLESSGTLVEIGGVDQVELEIYLELKAQRDQYNKMKAKLIGTKEKPGKYHGKNALQDDIAIKTIKYPQKAFKYPDDVKEKHRVEDKEIIKTTIERISP